MMTYGYYVDLIERRLRELLSQLATYPVLREAMSYSALAGGKRIRPVLHLMANELMRGKVDECMDFACALEMIHTYSLVHDDLPAMDNDDLRRGKPTCHKVYGDGTAILAGDALLSWSYEVMIRNALTFPESLPRQLEAMHVISRGSGTSGMLAGQSADLSLEGKEPTRDEVSYISVHKTADLIEAAVVSGAVLAGADHRSREALSRYGRSLGLAFQMVDDVLDATSSAAILGKSPGKDAAADKCTYVKLYGVHETRSMASRETERAVEALGYFGGRADSLRELAYQTCERSK